MRVYTTFPLSTIRGEDQWPRRVGRVLPLNEPLKQLNEDVDGERWMSCRFAVHRVDKPWVQRTPSTDSLLSQFVKLRSGHSRCVCEQREAVLRDVRHQLVLVGKNQVRVWPQADEHQEILTGEMHHLVQHRLNY